MLVGERELLEVAVEGAEEERHQRPLGVQRLRYISLDLDPVSQKTPLLCAFCSIESPRRCSYLRVPNETRCMLLKDILSKCFDKSVKAFGPLDVSFISVGMIMIRIKSLSLLKDNSLVLVVLDNAVGVELGSVLHLGNIRGRFGGLSRSIVMRQHPRRSIHEFH